MTLKKTTILIVLALFTRCSNKHTHHESSGKDYEYVLPPDWYEVNNHSTRADLLIKDSLTNSSINILIDSGDVYLSNQRKCEEIIPSLREMYYDFELIDYEDFQKDQYRAYDIQFKLSNSPDYRFSSAGIYCDKTVYSLTLTALSENFETDRLQFREFIRQLKFE